MLIVYGESVGWGKNNLQWEEDDADSYSYLEDKAWVDCRGCQSERGGNKIEYPMQGGGGGDWKLFFFFSVYRVHKLSASQLELPEEEWEDKKRTVQSVPYLSQVVWLRIAGWTWVQQMVLTAERWKTDEPVN